MSWLDAIPVVGDIADVYTAAQANKTNKKIAREQMAFQERMANTAMQRRVQDLRAAGLNPMLAGMNQSGADSPSGASTRVEPLTQNTGSKLAAAANLRLTNAAAEKAEEEAETARYQREWEANRTSAQNTDLYNQQMRLTVAETEEKYNQLLNANSESQLRQILQNMDIDQLKKMMPVLFEVAQIERDVQRLGLSQAQAEARYYETMGGFAPVLSNMGGIVGGIGGLIGIATSVIQKKWKDPEPETTERTRIDKYGEIKDRTITTTPRRRR